MVSIQVLSHANRPRIMNAMEGCSFPNHPRIVASESAIGPELRQTAQHVEDEERELIEINDGPSVPYPDSL